MADDDDTTDDTPPEPPKVEVVKTREQAELKGFVEEAKDALGLGELDLPGLIKEVMKAGEEDRRWRTEIMRRLEVLVNNQRLIYDAITGDLKPIIKKAEK